MYQSVASLQPPVSIGMGAVMQGAAQEITRCNWSNVHLINTTPLNSDTHQVKQSKARSNDYTAGTKKNSYNRKGLNIYLNQETSIGHFLNPET
jgi:hypothetical protein